jgi:hypothetical protein
MVWADEEKPTSSALARNGISPLVLVCVALILMVAVYFGATMLMNQ